MSGRIDIAPGLGNPQIADFGGSSLGTRHRIAPSLGAPGGFLAPNAGQLPPGIGAQTLPKNVMRIGEQCLWSGYQWHSGDALANGANFDVFTTGLNSLGQGYAARLTIAETNLRESARIPDGYSFVTLGIALHPYYTGGEQSPSAFGVTAADLRNLQNNGVFAWKFLQTVIEISPMILIGSGGGIFGSTADTGAADGAYGGAREVLNNGPGSLWVYQQFPMTLYSGVTFSSSYLFGSLAAPVDGDADGNASDLNLRTMLVGRFDVGVIG